MVRLLSYALLFLISMLFQTFLFDNLAISVYFSPLVYIAFIALLPMETPPIVMLLCGLLSGVTMDWTMGLEGINTAVTLFAAFSRRAVLNLACGKENVREGGVPTVWRLGNYSFLLYLVLFVSLHHLSFFLLESLSWSLLPFVLIRFVVSSAVSVCILWLASQLFVSKLSML